MTRPGHQRRFGCQSRVIATGNAADFVILDKDPTEVDPATIREMPVRETWLDGERRFQA
jgi:predicted amidohydrolase YtcJ